MDVVVGALATGLFTIKILDVNPPVWWWFVLALAVWVVYTVDHLLDGWNTQYKPAVIYRHIYHYRYHKALISLLFLAILIILTILFLYSPAKLIQRGLIISLIVLIYFVAGKFSKKMKRFLFQKELFIAMIYVTGIAVGPVTFSDAPLQSWQVILMISLILLAWAEGVMAAYFDYEKDLHDGHISFATVFGKTATRYFLIALHIFIFIILKINILLISDFRSFAAIMIEMVMNLLLLLILLNPATMQKNDRFRIFGEMIFWLPALIIFF